MEHSSAATKQWVLPISVTSRVDLGRLIRELDQVDEFLNQAAIREPGTSVKVPKTSRLMDEIVNKNSINLLRGEDRQSLKNFLLAVKAKAAVLHMSFSSDPVPAFTNKLVDWLRREIHPFLLLDVGLQPTIGVGSIVRTTNKIFDFSLRQRLLGSRDILLERLHKELAETRRDQTNKAAEEPKTETVPGQQQAAASQQADDTSEPDTDTKEQEQAKPGSADAQSEGQEQPDPATTEQENTEHKFFTPVEDIVATGQDDSPASREVSGAQAESQPEPAAMEATASEAEKLEASP